MGTRPRPPVTRRRRRFHDQGKSASRPRRGVRGAEPAGVAVWPLLGRFAGPWCRPLGSVRIPGDLPGTILPPVLGVLKAAAGSDISETVSRKPRPFRPGETPAERRSGDGPTAFEEDQEVAAPRGAEKGHPESGREDVDRISPRHRWVQPLSWRPAREQEKTPSSRLLPGEGEHGTRPGVLSVFEDGREAGACSARV